MVKPITSVARIDSGVERTRNPPLD